MIPTKKWRIIAFPLGVTWLFLGVLLLFLPLAKNVVAGLISSKIYALGNTIDEFLGIIVYSDPPKDYPLIIPISLFVGLLLLILSLEHLDGYLRRDNQDFPEKEDQLKLQTSGQKTIQLKKLQTKKEPSKRFWLVETLLLLIGGSLGLTGALLFRQFINQLNDDYSGYYLTGFYYVLLVSLILGLLLGLGSLFILVKMIVKERSNRTSGESLNEKPKEKQMIILLKPESQE